MTEARYKASTYCSILFFAYFKVKSYKAHIAMANDEFQTLLISICSIGFI